MKHPFRKLAIHSYSPNTQGDPHVAYIGPVGKLAMHFLGETRQEAEAKAQKFRDEAIEKNEQALTAREEAAIKRAKK